MLSHVTFFFLCVQISDVLEDGRHWSSQSHRETVLQHCANQMLCAEAREAVREAVVVGEMPQTGVQEAGVPQRQHPLLRNMAQRAVIHEEQKYATQSTRSASGRECCQRKSSSS